MRISRSKKQLIIFIMIGVMLVATTVATLKFLYINQLRDSYELKLTVANNTIKENKKFAYIAKEKIGAGEEISKDKVEHTEVFTSVPEESLITDKDFGKLSKIDISPQIPVTKDMITENKMDKDLREEEFNVFYLSSNLQEGDYVDIRLIYPNGEDYVVLPKKAVKNLSLGNNNCFMWLNEQEILTISGAIVDAYLHSGCKLYTTKYIEPSIQEASKVTYTPNADVLSLINSDPNIVQKAMDSLSVEVRGALEDRLTEFYSNYNGEVTWDKTNSNYQNTNPGSYSSDATNGETVESTEDDADTSTEDTEESEETYYVD